MALKGFVVRKGDIVRAFVNHCPHAGFPLNWHPDQFLAPTLAVIRCVMHGALFDIDNRRVRRGPVRGARVAVTRDSRAQRLCAAR
jgi:nitrite reductase/ring-hydroxylating ferredoxin subunit